jgi:sulfoxide reductase heme-binding subunit YedZ
MTIAGTLVETPTPRRWWLFWLLAAIVAAAAGSTALQDGFSVESIRAVIRLTAQMSLLLFCIAFSASALARLWPHAATQFLLTCRRQFGLAFAFSHGVHALALVTFARMSPLQFREATDVSMFIFGGLAYLFILAMAVTSFDQTAAWLGPRRWRLLHLLGAYDIWITFLAAEGKRAVHSVHYWPYVALLLIALALRLSAARK